MESAFRCGAREGVRDFLPISVGLLPWAVVTGIAMRSIGLSEFEALGMNLLVYAGTAQLGALPLIAAGARLLSSYLLVDGVFAICADKAIACDDPQWRWGYYIAPSVFNWLVWQLFVAGGVFGAEFVPSDWSLEFMVTIALMVLVLPMLRSRPMLVAALAGGLGAVLLRGLPLRLGVVAGIAIGIAAGFAAEHWQQRREAS